MKTDESNPISSEETLVDAGSKVLSLSVAQIKSILNDGGESINELTDSFVELASTFNELINHKTDIDHTDLAAIKKQIEQGIVSFQFYDRISQRLEHVANSLDRMTAILEASHKRHDAQQWHQLTQMIFNKYTMESERLLFAAIEQGLSAEQALEMLEQNSNNGSDTGDIELF